MAGLDKSAKNERPPLPYLNLLSVLTYCLRRTERPDAKRKSDDEWIIVESDVCSDTASLSASERKT